MNGKHSLDDLFGRVLRDAEATPPAAVWEGILRRRGLGYRSLQRMRRNWGYGLVAVLLLSGGVAYWANSPTGPAPASLAETHAQVPANAEHAVTPAEANTPTGTAQQDRQLGQEAAAEHHDATTPQASSASSSIPSIPVHTSGNEAATPGRTAAGAMRSANGAATNEHTASAAAGTATEASTARHEAPLAARGEHAAEQRTTASDARHSEPAKVPAVNAAVTIPGAGGTTNTASNASGKEPGRGASVAEAADNSTRSAAAAGTTAGTPKAGNATSAPVPSQEPAAMPAEAPAPTRTERTVPELMATKQQGLYPALERGHGDLAPTAAPALPPPYVLPASDWWIAFQGGTFHEDRTWHGNDVTLVNALDRTEVPHYPWSIGLMGGLEYRSGWGISAGAEMLGAQYHFVHDDRFVDRSETVTQYVVTLNTQVIDSYTDTVVNISEQHKRSQATNTYSAVRVPVEVSYHRTWRRLHYGLRVGVAAEFVTMRSGLTLSTAGDAGSEYAVDMASGATEERSNSLFTGSLGLDLGYMLSERLTFWATPCYARGLFPIGGGDAVYALPDRVGVRFRLAYTFPHR